MPRNKAQSILDYAVFIIILIAVLSIMAYYVRNSLSGRFRDMADVFGSGEVYQPGQTQVTVTQ
jgi:hypothetical protein